MLGAPSPSLGYLLADGLEAVPASCWNLALFTDITLHAGMSFAGYSMKTGAGETKTVPVIDGYSVS